VQIGDVAETHDGLRVSPYSGQVQAVDDPVRARAAAATTARTPGSRKASLRSVSRSASVSRHEAPPVQRVLANSGRSPHPERAAMTCPAHSSLGKLAGDTTRTPSPDRSLRPRTRRTLSASAETLRPVHPLPGPSHDREQKTTESTVIDQIRA
jgi:hypothetical protein